MVFDCTNLIWPFINQLIQSNNIYEFKQTEIFNIFSDIVLNNADVFLSENSMWINNSDPIILDINKNNLPFYNHFHCGIFCENLAVLFIYLQQFYTKLNTIPIKNNEQLSCLISYTSRSVKLNRAIEIMDKYILKENHENQLIEMFLKMNL